MCHNFGPSIIIIIDYTYQHLKNNNFKSKNSYSATCQILMDGWKLVTLALRYGYSYSEVT
jgi:hypothetical protein